MLETMAPSLRHRRLYWLECKHPKAWKLETASGIMPIRYKQALWRKRQHPKAWKVKGRPIVSRIWHWRGTVPWWAI